MKCVFNSMVKRYPEIGCNQAEQLGAVACFCKEKKICLSVSF